MQLKKDVLKKGGSRKQGCKLGTGQVNKSDEFSEKFQTAFDPPPLIFGKLYCAFRDKIVTKVRMLIWRHCCVLYDPISHEMHVVQMFNMVIG